MLQNPDGRIVFTIPYEDEFTVVGTADVPFDGKIQPNLLINDGEIDYLCQTANRYFRHPLAPSDVRWSYAGIRRLSDDEENKRIEGHARLQVGSEWRRQAEAPLLSVFGGKITTYRRLAESALLKLRPFIGGTETRLDRSSARTARRGSSQRRLPQISRSCVQRRWPFLPAEMANRLARAYGTRISDLAPAAAKHMDDLGRNFGGGLTSAELEYLYTHEWAQSLEDVLWRRTKLGLHMQPSQCAALSQYLGEAGFDAPPASQAAT